MPTKKTRLTFAVPEELLTALERYRRSLGTRNISATILSLLERGLAEAGQVSDEAVSLAAAYDRLDEYGRLAVQGLLMAESRRCADEKRLTVPSRPEAARRVIHLYEDAAAAGLALAQTGQGAVPYELGPDDPVGASYGLRIRGDSMSPAFPDGSVVFVNHDPMADGDIGVFCVDGATVIKQWHRDALGVTYLFSLNRSRSDADVVLPPESGRMLVWQGRVMTRRRFPLPEEA